MSAALETLVVHGLAALRWADGSTGDLGPNARPLLGVSDVVPTRFASLPRGLRVLERTGGLAFTFEEALVVAGAASAADLEPPALAPFDLEGIAGGKDADGRWSAFLPRRFRVSLARRAQRSVVLYRTPASTPRPSGVGGLIATCRAPDGRVVPWALLTLGVTVPPGGVREFRAQADEHGDVMLAPQRLPPLPVGVAEYVATLSVLAGPPLAAQAAPEPVDPADLPSAKLRPVEVAGAALASIALTITPGVVRRLTSAGQPPGQTALIIEP
jgi:hypothetical protein